MPKNRVRFQKGLSLARFLQDYGTEPQCEQALFHARWPDGLSCTRCGSARFCRLSTRRTTFQCNRCKRQISLLAGTLFQATKLPLTTWFLAMYLLTCTATSMGVLFSEPRPRLPPGSSPPRYASSTCTVPPSR